MSSEPYPHRYLRETVLTGAGWEYRCRCGLGSPYGGERERDCPAAMREEIAQLCARLTAANKSVSLVLTQMDSLIADVRKFGAKVTP